jgi:hypothetical protein
MQKFTSEGQDRLNFFFIWQAIVEGRLFLQRAFLYGIVPGGMGSIR